MQILSREDAFRRLKCSWHYDGTILTSHSHYLIHNFTDTTLTIYTHKNDKSTSTKLHSTQPDHICYVRPATAVQCSDWREGAASATCHSSGEASWSVIKLSRTTKWDKHDSNFPHSPAILLLQKAEVSITGESHSFTEAFDGIRGTASGMLGEGRGLGLRQENRGLVPL